MITPQIIHTEPDHTHNSEDLLVPLEGNHPVYSSSYRSVSPKYKQEQHDYRSSSVETSSSSPQKKVKKEVDSSKPYKCSQCAYSFNRRDHLTRHSLVHSKLKPYHCSFCSKVYSIHVALYSLMTFDLFYRISRETIIYGDISSECIVKKVGDDLNVIS